MINLALVSGVVRGSGGTGWSEWLGRSGGWDGEVVGWYEWTGWSEWSGLLSLDVMHSKKYMVCKKREKSYEFARIRSICTDIHVKLDRFPPRFHHCLAELEHGQCYLN